MPQVKWSQPFTADAPPRPRRRAVEPAQLHTNKEWEEWRPRIEELYENCELKEVTGVLREEGFIASERQLRARLGAWGAAKYLSLSKAQWEYIEQKAVDRTLSNPAKTSACRFKVSKKRLPSSNIQRGLDRRFAKMNFRDVLSVNGTISSHGISVFTSDTKGFHLKPTLLKFDNRSLVPSTRTVTNPNTSMIPEEPEAEQETVRSIYQNWRTMYPLLGRQMSDYESDVQEYSEELTDIPEHFIKEFNGAFRNLRRKHLQDKFQFRARLMLSWGLSYCDIICADCPGYYFVLNITDTYGENAKVPWLLDHDSLAAKVVRFEDTHLCTPTHRGRVTGRVLGNTEQWKGRQSFVAKTGITCGHPKPPARDEHGARNCWSPGGCRWSQLKALDEKRLEALGSSREGSPSDTIIVQGGSADIAEGREVDFNEWVEVSEGDREADDMESQDTEGGGTVPYFEDLLSNWLKNLERSKRNVQEDIELNLERRDQEAEHEDKFSAESLYASGGPESLEEPPNNSGVGPIPRSRLSLRRKAKIRPPVPIWKD